MLNCKDLYTEYIGVWNLSVIYFSKWSHATPEVDFPGGSDGKDVGKYTKSRGQVKN